MDIKTLVADSKAAFVNGNFEKSLELALKAIQADVTFADAYTCAANASMSLEKYDQAVKFYKEAVKNDVKNGDRYYQLGYALVASDKMAEALKALTRSEELGCSKEITAELYQLMGLMCFDMKRFDDALANLKKAEYIMGPSIEMMNRMAIIYSIKNDIKKGIFIANQMKLMAPTLYTGYRLAANFLLQAKKMDKVAEEFGKAEKYAELTMDYYIDRMAFEVEKYRITSDKKHLSDALVWLETGLKNSNPSTKSVAESYINSADIYVQLGEADKAINCLNAVADPVSSFNLGFKIIPDEYVEKPLTEYDVEVMMEEDHLKNEENYGEDGILELAGEIEADEDGYRDYLTVLEDEEEDETKKPEYKIPASDKYNPTDDDKDQINRLFIASYTLKNEYEQVIRYSKLLQGSKSPYISYMGRYVEVNAMKNLGSPETASAYEELIKFFKKSMMIDPTNTAALTYRIQCNIDICNFDEAEHLCELLNNSAKSDFMEKIKKARSGGDM